MNRKAIAQVAEALKEQRLDALLVAPSEDLVFLMGSSPFLCERFQGLFVKADGSCFYVANRVSAGEVKRMLGKDAVLYTWWDGDDFTEIISEILNKEGLASATIGTSEAVQAFHVLGIMENTDVRFVGAKDLLNNSRICKDSHGLDCLRKAAKIADQALMDILDRIHPGMTEGEIMRILFQRMEELGGSRPGGLVSSGPNTSYPHYIPVGEGRTLLERDVLLLDYGCRFEGYQSDTTRTFFIGEASEYEKSIFKIVREANLAGEAAVHEGAFIPDIDRAAREVIENAGYGDMFTTRLGHGIGYNVHEAPDIKQSNKSYLRQGMAFSIEPGIYLEGEFGVRIEDIVVINEHGEREILNKNTKEIIVI